MGCEKKTEFSRLKMDTYNKVQKLFLVPLHCILQTVPELHTDLSCVRKTRFDEDQLH